MSQRPPTFNIFGTPSAPNVPIPMFGSGYRTPGPGRQQGRVGGGLPINFYFQGHNNNVDINVYPGPGSNIHIYGRGRGGGGTQGGRYLPRLPAPPANEVDQDYSYDWTYEDEKLRLAQQQSHAEANRQAQAPTPSVSGGRALIPPVAVQAEQLNTILPAETEESGGEAGLGRSRSKQPGARGRGRGRGSKI